jgi:glyoxylase-like metal-dependent hydrolase (beta-lactamase superfamily II)
MTTAPGQMAVSISAEATAAVLLGDAVPPEHFPHPDWTSEMDIDRAEAARTQRRLPDSAANDGAIVFGYHLWRPGS